MRRLLAGAVPVVIAVFSLASLAIFVSVRPAGAHGSCSGGSHQTHRSDRRRILMGHGGHGEHHRGSPCDDHHGDDHHGDDHHGDDHHGGSEPCVPYQSPVNRQIPTNTIKGTPGPDAIVGTSGADLIYGLGGDDRIRGGGGDDRVVGGLGDDRIEGGDDDDNLWGGPGDDRIRGGDGRDHVVGDNGEDRLDGGDNCDNILGGSADDELFGGDGVDKLDGDNSAPAFGFGAADYCDGGPETDIFLNCELP